MSDQSSRICGFRTAASADFRKLLLSHEVNKSCFGRSHAALRRLFGLCAATHVPNGHPDGRALRHRHRRPEAPGARPDPGRFSDLRQRQAAGARSVHQRSAAHHGRRDARHEREHDRQSEAARAGGRAVPPADAAERQGPGRRVQRQDRVLSRRRSRTTATG